MKRSQDDPAGWRPCEPPGGWDRFQASLLELIKRTVTRLPDDLVAALSAARMAEAGGSRAFNTLATMLENCALAQRNEAPLCQDTGSVVFWVRHPFGYRQQDLKAEIRAAVVESTNRCWLRPNCVEALSGKNPGNNLDPFGEGHPTIHFQERDGAGLEIDLLLKGGGSENVGAQYRLPEAGLGAGRDLEGVRRCVIDAVVKAQGQGCAPGILGVCIGGDRATGLERSKAALLRRLGTANPDPVLDRMERQIVEELNSLGIGPMGYGGRTTVLGVFLDQLWRHPASFFVSISYMCWSSRRARLTIAPDGTPAFDQAPS
jgi:fumarate hydratase class I